MHRRFTRLRSALMLLFALLLLAGCGGAKATVSAPPTAIVAPATTAPVATVPATTPRLATIAAPAMSAPIMPMPAVMPMMRADVPTKAYDTLRYVETHNGNAPPGYQGDTVFENREGRLPPGQYKEYDVDARMSGGRNAERLVINQRTGQAYYTRDHYETFVSISPGR